MAVKDITHWAIIIYMAQLVLVLIRQSHTVDYYNELDIQLGWKTRYAYRFWFTKLFEGGYFEDRGDKIPAHERKDTMEDILQILWSVILTVSMYSWPLH